MLEVSWEVLLFECFILFPSGKQMIKQGTGNEPLQNNKKESML